MRVICPRTKAIRKVVDALDASGYPWEAHDVSNGQFSYFHLVNSLWDEREGWMNVEHDIVINPDTLKSFEECEHDWCIAPYPYLMMPEGVYAGLGCCKFSADLIKRNPDAMKMVGEMSDKSHKARHWCRVDGYLKYVLIESGERPHAHEHVQHLGDGWPSHGCVKKP